SPTPSHSEPPYYLDDRHDNSEPDQYDGGNYPCHEEPVILAGAARLASGIALKQIAVFGVLRPNRFDKVVPFRDLLHKSYQDLFHVRVCQRTRNNK
ncbi:MAG TPA: hypothetical protein VK603_11025, partial [Candidatus Saccharimonadales bacterium]|nr:hypothetical protein [Candidatus Saccharimonadales bacterium]